MTATLPPAIRGLKAATGIGILAILAASLLLTANDAVAKWVMGAIPVSQFIFTRALVILAALLIYIAASRQLHVLRVNNWKAMLLRCLGVVGSSYLFLAALQRMPMADSYAIAFAAPMITLLLAIVFLGEKVGWRRSLAVAIGFLGVSIALLPSGQGYSWTVALLPLASAICSSLRDVASRRLSATESTLGILVYTVLAMTLLGAAGLTVEPWVSETDDSIWLILLCALLQGSAHWLQIEAYRCAEVSVLMPFRYVSLVFAALAGYLIWQDVPTWNVFLGSFIIVGSGLFVWYRERRLARLRRRQPPPSTQDPSPI